MKINEKINNIYFNLSGFNVTVKEVILLMVNLFLKQLKL